MVSRRGCQIPSGAADAAREFAQDIERWHDEAGSEARTGINWSHDWAARSHAYKPGQALRELPGSATATSKTPSRINLSRIARWNVVKP